MDIRERILAPPLVGRLPESMRQRFVMILLWLPAIRAENLQQRIKEM